MGVQELPGKTGGDLESEEWRIVMKQIIIIETADELINGLIKPAIPINQTAPANYLPTNELKVGTIKDTYVSLEVDGFQLGPGITMKSIFIGLCNQAGIKLIEEKI